MGEITPGYIFCILQHFVTKFCNFTDFNKFFTGISFFLPKSSMLSIDDSFFLCMLLFKNNNVFKDDFHSVLRISSAHNKGGAPDINIAQILDLSNFFELKCRVYIHLQA